MQKLINTDLVYSRRTDIEKHDTCGHCGDETTTHYYETFNDDGFVQAGEFCGPACALKSADMKLIWMSKFYSA